MKPLERPIGGIQVDGNRVWRPPRYPHRRAQRDKPQLPAASGHRFREWDLRCIGCGITWHQHRDKPRPCHTPKWEDRADGKG